MKLSLIRASVFGVVIFLPLNLVWAANNPLPDSETDQSSSTEPVKADKKKNVIYQWVDENGNTVISDRPHEGAIEIPIPKPQTYKPVVTQGKQDTTSLEKRPQQLKVFDTTPLKLKVITPAEDSWLDNNLGNAQISVAVTPFLRSGQLLVIKLDDKIISKGLSLSTSVSGLDRGTHKLSIQVVMESTGKVIAEKQSTFHVRRPVRKR